ncbi:MAG: DUF1285 domain-containing protein [Alphaproteobacteria bacterium]|nr:DUF1285 domain-containing protein [Alphaproteobacteria bacterium]
MAEIPDICVGGAFRIDPDGTWYHDGAPIARTELVKLFARVLTRDAAGRYWLQTPAEKVPVEVLDAPFVAVELAVEGAGTGQRLSLRTNVDHWVELGAAHPLIVRSGPRGPRPYVALGNAMEALVARPVYYALAELAVEGADGGSSPGVWSGGVFHRLAPERQGGSP